MKPKSEILNSIVNKPTLDSKPLNSSTPLLPSPFSAASTAQGPNAVKLYLHVGGNTPKAKWIVSKKTAYSFVKISNVEDDLDYDNDEKMDREGEWFLKVSSKV